MLTNLMQRTARLALVGVATTLLLACSGGGGGGAASDGDAVRGTFVDAPVQGLIYKTGGWTALEPLSSRSQIASSANGNKLVAVEMEGNIYISSNSGETWAQRESRRPWIDVASSDDGSKLVAVVLGGQIYTSSDSGQTWTPRDSNRPWRAVASSTDGKNLVAVADGDHIYTSSDSGATWTARATVQKWEGVASSSDGKKLVAAVWLGQIHTSSDWGATWTPHESDRRWTEVASSADGNKLVAVGAFQRIYTSSDSGATWTPRESVRSWYNLASSADGSKVVAGAYKGQIYSSSDSGATWTARESDREWYGIASSADGSKLVAGTFGGQIHTYREPTNATTGMGGRYTCTAGADTTFYLGSFTLGNVKCGEAVHVYQMAGTGSSINKGLRIAQLLQSLDLKTVAGQITLPDMSGITIDASLLDPNDDDAAFTTKANALLAAVQAKVQTSFPGKTFTLVTPAAAQAHVAAELAKLSDTQKAALCKVNHCNSQLLPLMVNPKGVSGSMSGLPEGKSIRLQLTLASTATQTLNVSANSSFGFPNVDPINDLNKAYSVTRIDTDESVSCGLSNAAGTLGTAGVSGVVVSCAAVPAKDSVLSGTVTGLAAGQNVTLSNGTDTLTVTSNGSFVLPAAIGGGLRYAVRTANPVPTSLACTVTNGSGIAPLLYGAGSNTISGIAVSCITLPTVSGTIYGLLEGDSVTLAVPSGTGNGTTSLTVNGSTAPTATYTTAGLASGTAWSVSVLSASANVTCIQGGGVTTAGTIATTDVTGVDFGCNNSTAGGGAGGGGMGGGGGGSTPTAGSVGGSIILGAGIGSVEITNAINSPMGSVDTLVVNEGATSFTMNTLLNGGDTYNISAGDVGGGSLVTCSLVNWDGTMPLASATPNYVNNVTINCNLTSGSP